MKCIDIPGLSDELQKTLADAEAAGHILYDDVVAVVTTTEQAAKDALGNLFSKLKSILGK